MGLLKTLQNIFREHSENLDKALSDPTRDGHFAIEDAQKEVTVFETKLQGLVGQTIQLKNKRDEAANDVQKYQTIAERAAQAQAKDDVVAALAEKNRAQGTLDSLTKEIEANERVQANAKEHIAAVRAKVEAAKNTESQATMRIATANLREDLAASASTFGKNNGLAGIDSLNEAADKAEAKAQAAEELSAETPIAKQQNLESKYSGNAAPNTNQEAEALLAKFGK